ncbi:MAG: urea carboxylase-associated family protein [Beijerinckiaceae bacterium]
MNKGALAVRRTAEHLPPPDADQRRAAKAVVCYPVDALQAPDLAALRAARPGWSLADTVTVAPRDAATFEVPAGSFFRIISIDGPQVGDLNLWAADNIEERFFSGKTRALHGTHVTTGHRLWSNLPYLRPLATITDNTLDWYGFDADGGGVHDVIGTRCDPYTHRLLSGNDYHHCCHSNLTRALAGHRGMPLAEAERHVHDVLNVFMCTGFTRDTQQYFMKASPVRRGDYIEFFAEVNLLGALSACPGGDCSSEHSSDVAACYPLRVEIYKPHSAPKGWTAPKPNAYAGKHGL